MKLVLSLLQVMAMVFLCGSGSAQSQSAATERNFQHFENRFVVGDLYRKSKPGKVQFEKCENSCKSIQACVAFSFDREKAICFLLKQVDKFEEMASTTSGILTSLTPPGEPVCSAELFRAAKTADSEGGYNTFLAKCKKGERFKKARNRLAEIVENQDWQNATVRGSCQAYDDYVKKYKRSNTPHLQEAKNAKKIACENEARQRRMQARERQERDDWQTALNKNSCSGYRRFLRKYSSSSGPFFQQATDKKTTRCEQERATRQSQSNEQPEQTGAPRCGWYVISGCYRDRGVTNKRARRIGARVIRTDDYPNFNPGWYCAVVGPFSKAAAQRKKYRYRPSYIKNGC